MAKLCRLSCTRIGFNDYDFIRLFSSLLSEKGNVIVDRNELPYELYQFYNKEEYRLLFEDFAIKHQIERSFVEMDDAFENAMLFGLMISCGNKKIIAIDPNTSKKIIDSYNEQYVNAMDLLTDSYINKRKKGNAKKLIKNI